MSGVGVCEKSAYLRVGLLLQIYDVLYDKSNKKPLWLQVKRIDIAQGNAFAGVHLRIDGDLNDSGSTTCKIVAG